MSRIARFARNAGSMGTVMTAIMAGFVIYVLIANPEGANARLLVPVLFLAFFAMYPLRGLLVDHLETTRRILTGMIILGGLAVFVLGRAPGKPLDQPEGQLGIVIYLGIYMGGYFWLLSDPRVGRGDDP